MTSSDPCIRRDIINLREVIPKFAMVFTGGASAAADEALTKRGVSSLSSIYDPATFTTLDQHSRPMARDGGFSAR